MPLPARSEDWDDWKPWQQGMTVHEPEQPEKTGLLDRHGAPIHRIRPSIGFIELKEHDR